MQIGIHPRLQRFIRVVDLQAQLQGAGGAIDAGEKGPFADAESFSWPGGNLNGELRGVFNQPGDGFRHRHADPHRIHALNFRHHIIFGDVHSGTQIEGGNHAIDRRFEGKAGLDFTRGFQAADIVIRHSGEAQALEDPLDLGGGAPGLLQQQIFALRFHPVRDGQLEERRALFHLVADGQRIDFIDKARRPRLHNHILVLVIANVGREGLSVAQRPAGDRGGFYAEILGLRRVDTHPRRTSGGMLLIGVFRHQIHIHKRRFTRFIEAGVRVHRIVPEQHFTLLLGRRSGSVGRGKPGVQRRSKRAANHHAAEDQRRIFQCQGCHVSSI